MTWPCKTKFLSLGLTLTILSRGWSVYHLPDKLLSVLYSSIYMIFIDDMIMLLKVLLVQLKKFLLKFVLFLIDLSQIILHELIYVDILIPRTSSGCSCWRAFPPERRNSSITAFRPRATLRILSFYAI
jgi:hypothetical protein